MQNIMSDLFSKSIQIPGDILFQELSNGEIVFLNLDNESYYGLDNVGSIIWNELTSSKNIRTAYDNLLEQFDVTPNKLKKDLEFLLEELQKNGIIEYS